MKKIISLAIAGTCILTASLSTVNASEHTRDTDSSDPVNFDGIEFGDGYIIERFAVDLGDYTAYVQRTTDKNNKATITVDESGKVSTFTCEVSYIHLYANLKGSISKESFSHPVLRGRVAGTITGI